MEKEAEIYALVADR